MNNNVLSISTERDLLTGSVTSNTFVKVYNTIFTSGIVARLGTQGFTTLLALATFMDEKGECFPTQEQVAERIGCHKNTANKYINELLAVEIDGKPIVTRTILNRGQGKISSYYHIHPISQLTKFNGKIEDVKPVNHKDKDLHVSDPVVTDGVDPVVTTNCDVIRSTNKNQSNKSNTTAAFNSSTAIKYFQEIYRDVYNVNYVVGNYGREGKLIKDKLLTPYTEEQAKRIIEIAVRQYATKWKSAKFPRPTISMFSWITNQVIELLEQEQELDEIVENADEAAATAEAEMLARLEKWGN